MYPSHLILISYPLCICPISFSSFILCASVPYYSYLLSSMYPSHLILISYPLCICPISFLSLSSVHPSHLILIFYPLCIRSISFLYFILYKSVLSHSHLLSYMYPSHLIPIFYPLCIRPISFPSFILYVSVTSHSHLCFSFSARMNREEKLSEYRLGRETEEDRMWRRRREWIERRIWVRMNWEDRLIKPRLIELTEQGGTKRWN